MTRVASSSPRTAIGLVRSSLFAKLNLSWRNGELGHLESPEVVVHDLVHDRLIRNGLAHSGCEDSELIEPSDFGRAVQRAGFISIDSAIATKQVGLELRHISLWRSTTSVQYVIRRICLGTLSKGQTYT